MSLYKTSAKNLYYILGYNSQTGGYDRCYSINTNDNEDGSRLILTRIRSEIESYWIIEPVENDKNKIRFKSAKNDRYFYHDRNPTARGTANTANVFEKQVVLSTHLDSLENKINNNEIVIKSGESKKDYDPKYLLILNQHLLQM